MFENKEQIVIVQDLRQTKKKEDHISDYIESLKAIEEAMEPYKEQKRELKKEYMENNWLTKEDISLSTRALRLLKDNIDIGELIDMYKALKEKHSDE